MRSREPFLSSPAPDPVLLASGLCPPLPIRADELIWGRPLVEAAARLGMAELASLELDVTEGEALLVALRLEDRRDLYGFPEKEAILNRALAAVGSAAGSGNPAAEAFMEEVGSLVQSEGNFTQATSRYSALEKGPKALVASGLVDLKTAQSLAGLSAAALSALASSAFGLTVSERRTAFRRFAEVARRDGLDETGQLALVDRAFVSGNAMGFFARERFPRLTEIENEFASIRDVALLKSGVTLEPPPFFEGEDFTVSFRFRDPKTLSARIRALSRLEGRCDDLVGLLH